MTIEWKPKSVEVGDSDNEVSIRNNNSSDISI